MAINAKLHHKNTISSATIRKHTPKKTFYARVFISTRALVRTVSIE